MSIAVAPADLAAVRRRDGRRHALRIAFVVAGLVLCFAADLMLGRTFTGPAELVEVLSGEPVPGASFTVLELRLPRAVLAVLGGFALGMAGAAFQGMLGNPLASPDILGISAGAGTAAVLAILVLGWNDTATAIVALIGALVTAAVIFSVSGFGGREAASVSGVGGFAGTRFILIGVGLAAMLQSTTSYLIARSAEWDMQRAMQWLSGSINGAAWERVLPLAGAVAVLVPILLLQAARLEVLRLGPSAATALGIPVARTRALLLVTAVALLAFATAACGPIMFVSFMAGPIALRLIGSARSPLLAAGLVGALLVIAADLIGQHLLAERYPVGIITGAVGAPYLVLLLIRMNRKARA